MDSIVSTIITSVEHDTFTVVLFLKFYTHFNFDFIKHILKEHEKRKEEMDRKEDKMRQRKKRRDAEGKKRTEGK